MTNGHPFAAARAWLNLSQKDLATAIDMTQPTIAAMERDPDAVSRGTVEAVTDYFRRRGLEISATGLKVLREPRVVISGNDWYSKLLDDVDWSGATDLWVEFADDRVSPPEVTAKLRALRTKGVGFRVTVAEDNTHIAGQLSEYRLIPSALFENVVTAIYGDNVAVGGGDRASCTIFRDADLARVSRARFNMVWQSLQTPTITTAGQDERY